MQQYQLWQQHLELLKREFLPELRLNHLQVGVYDSDSDVEKEGGRVSVADVKKAAKNALSYAKRKGVLTDAVDSGEKYLLSKAT
ncbi:hypothetical protein PI124_g2210 [Phytophthora idaei]|nr:hypothetical protein PI125_g1682 [Phytophthora idaei]KAG3172413.1 hypothetical protein PI126_g1372 [Phytophthora idaei]KAG3253202.1 hypothetical protein PI124_g2210 [Phytophthora idaei]